MRMELSSWTEIRVRRKGKNGIRKGCGRLDEGWRG